MVVNGNVVVATIDDTAGPRLAGCVTADAGARDAVLVVRGLVVAGVVAGTGGGGGSAASALWMEDGVVVVGTASG